MNISKEQIQQIAFDLYKEEWLREHISQNRLLDAKRNYHVLKIRDYDNKYSFDDYLFDMGFNGEIYVCIDEFLNNEFLDVKYIHSLLKIPELKKAYDKVVFPLGHEYLDCEFYSIEIDPATNEKQVHIWGYVYDSCVYDNKPYRNLEYVGFIVPLKEFIAADFNYTDVQQEIKSYIGDMSEQEAYALINNYFGCAGNKKSPVELLLFGGLTMDTPCGDYVNYSE